MSETSKPSIKISWQDLLYLRIWKTTIHEEVFNLRKKQRLIMLVFLVMFIAIVLSIIDLISEDNTAMNNQQHPTDRRRISKCSFDGISINCKFFNQEIDMEELMEQLNNTKDKENVRLNLESATFKNNRMVQGWFPDFFGPPKIDHLQITSDTLEEIDDNSFTPFQDLQHLTICNTAIRRLTKNAFKNLGLVIELSLRDNKHLQSIEEGLLHEFSLQILQIQGMVYNKLEDGELFFKNLTGQIAIASIQIFDLEFNDMAIPPIDLLKYLPGVISLYLSSNGIQFFETNPFTYGQRLGQIGLESNIIETLSEEVFGPSVRRGTKINAVQNRIRCDCKMLWLQQHIQNVTSYNDTFGDFSEVKCFSPVELADVPFIQAEFCSNSEVTTDQIFNSTNATEITTTTKTTSSTSSTTDPSLPVQISCENLDTLLSKIQVNFETEKSFKIYDELSDGQSIEVYFNNPANSTFIWFCDECLRPQCNSPGTMMSSFSIAQLTEETNYVFCSISGSYDKPMGECVPYKTLPLLKNRIWLPKSEQAITYVLICTGVIIALIVGGCLAYLLVFMKPNLLRKSERIEIVKFHDGERVLVMPAEMNRKPDTTTGLDYETSSGYISIVPKTPPPIPPFPSSWVQKPDHKHQDGECHEYLEPRDTGTRLRNIFDSYEWSMVQQDTSMRISVAGSDDLGWV